ncbi:CpaF family protein [Fodinicurvata sp. EGI_FJ10296]|uniref:CpaF family protein n=1 Tax=Fodinicurvata sp. EGI_FJ10296 TaxID=3231908 RepID=UPI0034541AD1
MADNTHSAIREHATESRGVERDARSVARTEVIEALCHAFQQQVAPTDAQNMARRDLAEHFSDGLEAMLPTLSPRPGLLEQRLIVEGAVAAIQNWIKRSTPTSADVEVLEPDEVPAESHDRQGANDRVYAIKGRILPLLMERIDISVASHLTVDILETQIGEIVAEILGELKIQLNASEQRLMVRLLVDDMVGLGPLEPLLADDSITDIMVNGPKQIYVERSGKLELTDVTFRDNAHVMHVATRIVTRVGRRIDEASPLVDARLPDGSRVNIIVPPLAIDGPSISIRKFAKRKITLDIMARQGNITDPLATVLKVAGRCRLNILISGGTGSGKTTLLNAISRLVDHGERIVTIEDAAELQLQQPHVVRLETRPPNLEGDGEISMRNLVKNALRMRPDRIIMGEVRGEEAIDMLQAMNTGHDGSMCTLHANTPREALTRLENMVAMAGFRLPSEAVRSQIASAVHLIVQISRMRDGVRRVTQITEVAGMEGEVITLQDLFKFEYEGERSDGTLMGRHICSGFRPSFLPKAEYYGLGGKLMEAMGCH